MEKLLEKDVNLIFQGAESKVYLINITDKKYILKYRIQKEYRLHSLDVLIRKKRTVTEKRLLQKLECNEVPVPRIVNAEEVVLKILEYFSIEKDEFYNNCILMEYIEGNNPIIDDNFLMKAAEIIKKIHNLGIIHGDLTTANFIEQKDTLKNLFLIDFGLSFNSKKVEDKAVDLYNFERAVLSKNLKISINKLYEIYTDKEVLNRLEDIRQRGRKK